MENRLVKGVEDFLSPVGTMLDPKETWKFIEWLPSIAWHQAYVALLLIRSRGLKEKFGFKGTDHCLMIKFVPGYHTNPKMKLLLELRRMAVLAEHAPELFIYERHVSEEQVEIYRIPKELMTVMLSPNPSDWVKASVDTVKEFMDSVRDSVFNPDKASNLVRRIDVRLGANCMKRSKHVFHLIDLDDMSLKDELEEKIVDTLGYLPARITTVRGLHYLIKVSDFDRGTAKRWFTEIPKFIDELNKDRGEPAVEYKKNFQEPAPGILYRGIVPRFKPEEK